MFDEPVIIIFSKPTVALCPDFNYFSAFEFATIVYQKWQKVTAAEAVISNS